LAEFKKIKFFSDCKVGYNTVIISDKQKLDRIIYCMLSNSFKFTNEGFVGLCVRLKPDAEGKLGLKITVSDSGTGIGRSELS